MSCESTFFFECAVHEIDGLCEFGLAILDRLFDEVSQAFDANLAVDGLCEVQIPEFESDRVREKVQTALVDFEALFEVPILFKQIGVVDNRLRCGDAKLKDTLVHLLRFFQSRD